MFSYICLVLIVIVENEYSSLSIKLDFEIGIKCINSYHNLGVLNHKYVLV